MQTLHSYEGYKGLHVFPQCFAHSELFIRVKNLNKSESGKSRTIVNLSMQVIFRALSILHDLFILSTLRIHPSILHNFQITNFIPIF